MSREGKEDMMLDRVLFILEDIGRRNRLAA